MLKSRIPTQNLSIITSVFSEDFSSDRDFYNEKLLNFSTNAVINGVIDTEIYEYKPDLTDSLNFDIFFLRYVQNNEYDELKNYMESGFQSQYTSANIKFGLINSLGGTLTKGFNNVYETRQSNGLRETPVLSEKVLSKLRELQGKPYYVRDFVGESTLKKPIKSGLPIFYNSFTLPYWDSKDRWVNDDLLYTNKSYFFNSFLLLEFYDSPLVATQNRIQSIPIFVNRRYNITEKNISKNINYERPSFKLIEGTDGFSFFFLGDYITNEFYVRFSFWDALNGRKIPLLPSSDINPDKKWIQNPDDFNLNSRYVKYVLDYTNKTYKIFEYNQITRDFDTERTDFDLYELEFDPYYKNSRIPNQKPIDSRTQTVPAQVSNPFTFNIKNIYTTNYVPDSTNKYTQYTTKELDDAKLFLDITKPIMLSFNNYIGGIQTKIFGELPKTQTTLPVVNRVLTGYQVPIKSFLIKNSDATTWNIRNMEFDDITVSIDGTNITNTYYNQRQTLWNETPSYRISEAITLLNGLTDWFNFTYTPMEFTKDIIYTYLGDANIFRLLLNLIERERYNLKILLNDSYYYNYYGYHAYYQQLDEKIISAFLDKCLITLDVRYDQLHIKSRNYTNYAYDVVNKKEVKTYSEIYTYIDELVEKYANLKSVDIVKFDEIRSMAISLLDTYMKNQKDKYNICSGLVSYIANLLTPKDNPELVDRYIKMVSRKDVNLSDKTNIEKDITQNTLPLILDRVDRIGYEPRDYVLDTIAVYDGDKILTPNETNKIDVYFNVGEKVKFVIKNSSEIIITGKLRISVINNSGDTKNIIVPIKSIITTKNIISGGKTNIPKYNTSGLDPESGINQLTLIK